MKVSESVYVAALICSATLAIESERMRKLGVTKGILSNECGKIWKRRTVPQKGVS